MGAIGCAGSLYVESDIVSYVSCISVPDKVIIVGRVFLLDDHSSFRRSLARVLDEEPDIEVVGQAGSLAECCNGASEMFGEIDVAVLDLLLPDGTGIELVEDLREANPDVSVLVLTISRDREVHFWAAKMGVDEVLTKETSLSQVIAAIRRHDG